MKKLIEVKKNKNPILVGTGNEEIKTPIEITFTIDEKEYLTLTNVLNEYKWNIYDALTIFCEYANDIIPNFESIVNWQEEE